jgi:hypothetical protein
VGATPALTQPYALSRGKAATAPPHAAAAREATARRRRGARRPIPLSALHLLTTHHPQPQRLRALQLDQIARGTIYKAMAAVDEINDNGPRRWFVPPSPSPNLLDPDDDSRI